MVTLNNTAMNTYAENEGLTTVLQGQFFNQPTGSAMPRRHDADLRQRRRQASSGPVNEVGRSRVDRRLEARTSAPPASAAAVGSTPGDRNGTPARERPNGEAGVGAIGKLIAKKQKPSYDARHARNQAGSDRRRLGWARRLARGMGSGEETLDASLLSSPRKRGSSAGAAPARPIANCDARRHGCPRFAGLTTSAIAIF